MNRIIHTHNNNNNITPKVVWSGLEYHRGTPIRHFFTAPTSPLAFSWRASLGIEIYESSFPSDASLFHTQMDLGYGYGLGFRQSIGPPCDLSLRHLASKLAFLVVVFSARMVADLFLLRVTSQCHRILLL